MDSLVLLSLSGCSKVKKIPEFNGHMTNLLKLFLGGTAIEQIPSSIERLVGLAVLDISDCKSLLGLPSAMCNLKSLKTLVMPGCSKVDKLPGEMEWLEELDLSGTAMREPLVVMKNLKHLTFRGSVAKSSTSKDGICWGLDGLFGIRKSPDPWGLVLSSLNRLCSLTKLDLRDCNICEGAIPNDFGCLSSLERLILSGNNFISLPTSIRCLSKLWSLDLRRCKRLEQLPDLPSKRSFLLINVDDCTSLKRLSDPSKLSGGANVYDFTFSCLNCFRLVEEEGWTNRIFSRILKLAMLEIFTETCIVCPGSEIPDWFSNRSVGDSITVELPLPPQPSCSSDYVGMALCVVFEDSEYLENPAALVGYDYFKLKYWWGEYETFTVGHLVSQHLWVLYLPRKHIINASSSNRFSFEAYYCANESSNKRRKTNSIIKKCGARLVYERDVEEFSRILKIPN